MIFFALLLCIIGLWVSVYFTGISYHWFPASVKWVPQFCQLKETACQLVIETPRAKLFGIPNSVYGIGLYTYLLLFFLWKIGDGSIFGIGLQKIEPSPFWGVGFLAAGLATLRSIYLAYSLLFITRIPCPLCFTSHGINGLLFIYLWISR